MFGIYDIYPPEDYEDMTRYMNDEEATLISYHLVMCITLIVTQHSFQLSRQTFRKRFLLYFPPAMMQDIGIMAMYNNKKC